ncbi:hypothetical protein ALC57_01415, partial [Trachymyrmex cornetzi]
NIYKMLRNEYKDNFIRVLLLAVRICTKNDVYDHEKKQLDNVGDIKIIYTEPIDSIADKSLIMDADNSIVIDDITMIEEKVNI